MRWIFKPPCCRPGSLKNPGEIRQASLTTRQAQEHGRLCLGVRRNIVRAPDLLAGSGNVLGFIQPPSQHCREDFAGIEQRLFFGLTFREGIRQVNELHKKTAISLRLNRGGISDFHLVLPYFSFTPDCL